MKIDTPIDDPYSSPQPGAPPLRRLPFNPIHLPPRAFAVVSWGLWLVAVALCCVAFALAGCVSSGLSWGTVEELEAARTVVSVDPATGREVRTTYQPRTKTTTRTANYTDTRAAGAAAGAMLDAGGGIGGILANVSSGGVVGTAVTILGALGFMHKTGSKAAELKGREQGYSQAQLEYGVPVVPAPSQRTTS